MNKKNEVRNLSLIVTMIIVFIFCSFFLGYYLRFRQTEKEKTKQDIIQEIMEEEWYYGIDDEDIEDTLQTKMILGMLDLEKDPYTRYLTSLGSLADTYKGIGVDVSIYGEYFIVDEVTSQNAKADGLKKGDIILSINDVDVKNKTLEELTNQISNLNTDQVTLKVNRDGSEITLYTEVVSYDPLSVFVKDYSDILYVKITQFNMDTATYLNNYLNAFKKDNLVIDLRGNPGGYINAVRDVLDLFVESNKTVMSTVNKKEDVVYIKTSDDNFYVFNKIVVLIDENSASGAEALAAALNYHLDEKVILYGNTTYGKGSAQKTYTFSDGTYFHYTYALWNTPNGKTINKIGVEPEIKKVNEGISTLSISGKEELELYDYGNDILTLQTILKDEGLYNNELHSFMDEETVAALKLFQNRYGLNESGKLDTATVRYLVKLIYDDKQEYLDNELQEVLGSMF